MLYLAYFGLLVSAGLVVLTNAGFTIKSPVKATPITIGRIETETDAFNAAKLSIDVFFTENLPEIDEGNVFDKLQAPFRKKAREKMISTLFSRHLTELNKRLNKPNCLILKAEDENGKIIGLCEMFMSACMVDDVCDPQECEIVDAGVPDGLNSQEFEVNEFYKSAKVLGIASVDERKAEAANNILYYPKIANLAISPDIRRQGLGSKMVKQCLETAKQWSYPCVVLQVEGPNQRAREFYSTLGFEQVSIDKTTKAWDVSEWELKLKATPKHFMIYNL